MIALLLIPLLAILGRLVGGGLFMPKLPKWLERAPELIAAAIITYASGVWWLFPAIYFALEAGHGNAFHDGVLKDEYPDRHETLDYIVRPLCKILQPLLLSFDFSPRGKHYCRLFMATKGMLIGLPLGWVAPIVAVGYAAAYAIGWRVIHPKIEATVFGEYASYASIGLAIYLVL